MNINYITSDFSRSVYGKEIHNRIKELKSHKLDTEAHIRYMAEKHAKNHECIDCILSLVHCELTFRCSYVTVHMIAYCSLNAVPSAEAFGFCEMYFDYDKYDEDGAIVKVYKLNYCNRD